MGYYNDDGSHHDRRRPGRGRYLFLFGIVIGVLLVILISPSIGNNMFNQGVSDDRSNEQVADQSDSEHVPENINREITYDVNTKITEVVKHVSPTVVGVINIQQQDGFWNQQMEGSEAGTGSGVIYKLEGGTAYIVTNHHVIEGADTVEIVLSDETHLEAAIVGSDLFSDLAVLKMDSDLIEQAIAIGSSESVKVGEPAIAIGNPLGMAFSGSVTQGVISGKQRTIPQDFNMDGRPDWQAEVIQTDAAINPGNSGGALINIEGQLIGINSMKISQSNVEGIGFAIPIDSALPIIKELEEKGDVTRPYMGVELYSLEEVPQAEWQTTLRLPTDVEGGVYIWSVERLSPADQAGLQQLDVIVALDDKPVTNIIELRKILYQEKEIGDDVKVTYYRDGERQEKTMKLGVQ
ncbi:S1C family serine protease [Lentibacillus saliphilus]|uniref:S1C family serine protease n=1 Tax=Lentibacillus saliphilus TaxID=2737028 RepID=UPI001C2F34C7|nr:S1C family serine protease [Lentibacillus saliphilus]